MEIDKNFNWDVFDKAWFIETITKKDQEIAELVEYIRYAKEVLSEHWFSDDGRRNNDDCIEADNRAEDILAKYQKE